MQTEVIKISFVDKDGNEIFSSQLENVSGAGWNEDFLVEIPFQGLAKGYLLENANEGLGNELVERQITHAMFTCLVGDPEKLQVSVRRS